MNFEYSNKVKDLQDKLTNFMNEHVYKNEAVYKEEVEKVDNDEELSEEVELDNIDLNEVLESDTSL